MLTFILKQKQKNKQNPVGMFSLLPLPGAFLNSFLNPLKTIPQILTFISKCICHFLDTAQVYPLPFQLINLSPVFSSAVHLLQEDLSHGYTVVFTNKTTISGYQETADTQVLKCTTFCVWTGLVAPNQYSVLPENHSYIAR